MAKVVNKLFLVALCGISVLCGAYVAKSAPQIEGQVITTEVKHAPARGFVSTSHKDFTQANSSSSYSSNLVCVAEHVDTIESISQGSSVERGPVLQKNR